MDAPEALREFLSYVVANLIEHPQQASIAIGHSASGAVVFRVQLAPEDVRRVIGKNGMTVSSLRSLLNVAAERHGIKVSLKVGAAKDVELDESGASETNDDVSAGEDEETDDSPESSGE